VHHTAAVVIADLVRAGGIGERKGARGQKPRARDVKREERGWRW